MQAFSFAVAGPAKMNAFRVRGMNDLGYEVIDTARGPEALSNLPFYDTILLVKHHGGCAARLRASCRRLIYDPLDAWPSRTDAQPAVFWRECYEEIGFDDILAVSPSARLSIVGALPALGSEHVHLAPQNCDRSVEDGWYDPDGPIVYAGHRRGVKLSLSVLREAAGLLGRRFVMAGAGRASVPRLRGASLAVALRLPPDDTPLNRVAKPAIKLENAAAAGLPVLASDHPSITSLRPEVYRVPDTTLASGLDDVRFWAEHLDRALASIRLANPITLDQHASTINDLIRTAVSESPSSLIVSRRAPTGRSK